MPAWGTEGGGPLNDQQLTNLIEYIKEFQLSADEARQEVTDALDAAMESGEYESEGEALFNLGLSDGLAGGAYSCGRCHTLGWSYGQPEADGSGAYGPNLTNVEAQFPTAELQEEFITIGSDDGQQYGINGQGSGAMPGFGEMYTPEQIAAVVEYERSLGQ